MAIDTNELGLVSRAKPQATIDNQPRIMRLGRFGGTYTYNVVPTKHILADEGSYFVAADTAGRATVTAPTSFSDTAPLLAIQNLDSPANPFAKRLYLDYIRGVVTAAGTAGTTIQLQLKIDSTNRGISAGTAVTPKNVNMDDGTQSIGLMTVLPTTTAPGSTSRLIVNQSTVLTAQTAPISINSEWTAYFGGDGAKAGGSIATVGFNVNTFPPIVLGPGHILVVNFLITAQSAASSHAFEFGAWER